MGRFLIFLAFFVDLTIQQPEAFLPSELTLQQISENLIKSEANLVKKVSDLNVYVRYGSANIKAVNICPNLTNVLDKTLTTLKELSSIKNHGSFVKIANFTSCEFVGIRMAFLDMDMRKFHMIIVDVERNVTKIHKSFGELIFNYSFYIKTLVNYWTRELTILTTFKQMLATLNEYWKYIGQLKSGLSYFGDLNTLLSEMILNCTNSSSKFDEDGRKIEENLLKCEESLKDKERTSLDAVNAALLTVASSSPILRATTPSNKKVALDKLKNNLGKFNTANDYKKVSWPHIPDATGRASGKTMKLRAAQEKKKSYSKIWQNHKENQTKLENDENDLTANLQSTRQTRSTTLIDDILNSTLAIKSQFTTCMNLLNESMTQVDQMIAEIIVDIKAEYFCGQLLDYSLNNPTHDATPGFNGGLYLNASIIYPGTGIYPTCGGEKPARLTSNSIGAFSSCASPNQDLNDKVTAKYFVNHPQLTWKGVSASAGPTTPGALVINTNFYLIRFNLSAGLYTQIGYYNKVAAKSSYWNALNKTFVGFGGGFYEILTCSPPPTALTVIPSICAATRQVKYFIGSYKKTLCLAGKSVNHTYARTLCQLNNMNFYAITSVEDMDVIYQFVTVNVGNRTSVYYYADGVFDGSNWILNNSLPIFSGAVPVNGDGTCLTVTNTFGAIATAKYICTDILWPFCEYV